MPLTEESLRGWLVQRLADRVKVAPADVDTDQTFEEYGLDSRVAVQVSGALEKVVERRLSPGLLYEHQTIDEFDRLPGHTSCACRTARADRERDRWRPYRFPTAPDTALRGVPPTGPSRSRGSGWPRPSRKELLTSARVARGLLGFVAQLGALHRRHRRCCARPALAAVHPAVDCGGPRRLGAALHRARLRARLVLTVAQAQHRDRTPGAAAADLPVPCLAPRAQPAPRPHQQPGVGHRLAAGARAALYERMPLWEKVIYHGTRTLGVLGRNDQLLAGVGVPAGLLPQEGDARATCAARSRSSPCGVAVLHAAGLRSPASTGLLLYFVGTVAGHPRLVQRDHADAPQCQRYPLPAGGALDPQRQPAAGHHRLPLPEVAAVPDTQHLHPHRTPRGPGHPLLQPAQGPGRVEGAATRGWCGNGGCGWHDIWQILRRLHFYDTESGFYADFSREKIAPVEGRPEGKLLSAKTYHDASAYAKNRAFDRYCGSPRCGWQVGDRRVQPDPHVRRPAGRRASVGGPARSRSSATRTCAAATCGATAAGSPRLLVHGWASDSSSMHSLVPPLREIGFTVATFDAPAHGVHQGARQP